uniref:Tetratricopeptide repeat protein 7 N-terminal domain-containing protein n=1 Tax=Glossina pallidipes TaxID=7398 RepID=A0A1A9ZQW3_GLOPL
MISNKRLCSLKLPTPSQGSNKDKSHHVICKGDTLPLDHLSYFAGKLQEAINRYRTMLNAIEIKTTQSLRLTLAGQLAEVLLGGISGTIYSPPTQEKQTSGLWKSRKYDARNQFILRNQQEEAILLLLKAEAIAVKHTLEKILALDALENSAQLDSSDHLCERRN